jgi:hypothetical protein
MRKRPASVFAVPVFSLFAGCGQSSAPTDAVLLSSFGQKKVGLEKLVTMIRQDPKLGNVCDTWTHPDEPASIGVSKERISSYRQLLGQVGAPFGFEAYHDRGEFLFWVHKTGFCAGGTLKGYAYCTNAPDLIVDNLDTYLSADKRSFTAYRYITGEWYLVFRYDD